MGVPYDLALPNEPRRPGQAVLQLLDSGLEFVPYASAKRLIFKAPDDHFSYEIFYYAGGDPFPDGYPVEGRHVLCYLKISEAWIPYDKADTVRPVVSHEVLVDFLGSVLPPGDDIDERCEETALRLGPKLEQVIYDHKASEMDC